MRILLATYPEKTIFQPMVPLAWALRTAGHEVCVAGPHFFADEITQAGLTAVPLGRRTDLQRLLQAVGITPEMLEDGRAGLTEPWNAAASPEQATWGGMLIPYAYEAARSGYEMLSLLSGLVDFARHWQPDLVVWDPLTFAGPIAANACGAAHARLLWGIDVFALTRRHFLRLKAEQPDEGRADPLYEWWGNDPLADWLAGYGRLHGFEFTEDMTTGHFTIDQIPRSLALEADNLDYVRTRYIPYGGAATVPKWLHTPPERPRVALTMGLTATESFGGYNIPLADALDSLSDMDIEVVATLAESEQHKLPRVPDNVRLVSYVPLHALAPTCSAAINHAGFGTLTTFAQHAVPQLTLPYHFDEPIFARRLAEQGAGLVIDPADATGDTIRDGVRRLLEEATFRHGANRLRDEIDALPTPKQIVPEIEQLTTKHRTR